MYRCVTLVPKVQGQSELVRYNRTFYTILVIAVFTLDISSKYTLEAHPGHGKQESKWGYNLKTVL